MFSVAKAEGAQVSDINTAAAGVAGRIWAPEPKSSKFWGVRYGYEKGRVGSDGAMASGRSLSPAHAEQRLATSPPRSFQQRAPLGSAGVILRIAQRATGDRNGLQPVVVWEYA